MIISYSSVIPTKSFSTRPIKSSLIKQFLPLFPIELIKIPTINLTIKE